MRDENPDPRHGAIDKCPDLAAKEIARRLNDAVEKMAQLVAEASKHGTLICVGASKPDGSGKRWLVALATNDAAAHLETWCAEQAKMRVEAAANSGRGATAVIVGCKGEDTILKVEPKKRPKEKP